MLLKMLIINEMDKKLPAFMEPEASLLCIQKSVIEL
jgi:hypothetical protein